MIKGWDFIKRIGFVWLFILCIALSACVPGGISGIPPTDQKSVSMESGSDRSTGEEIDEEIKKADNERNVKYGPPETESDRIINDKSPDENGVYTTRDDVALFIHVYGKLPANFITKKEAYSLGWKGGSLEPYAPGKCIGGDYFGNYEGLLPEKDGREYHECDINTLGAPERGAERIVYSDDGLIYYTKDHYASFELLYDI